MAARQKRPPSASSTKAKGSAASTFALDEKLDTTKTRDLAAALLARRGAPVAIDASAVRHLGAQCAQVLLSARITWAQDGQDFRITATSEGFGESLRLLGLANDLGVTGA